MVMVTVVMAAQVVVYVMFRSVNLHREYPGPLAGAVIPITVQREILEQQVMQALHLPD